MALTLVQSPYNPTPRGQKLMIVATSTNVGEDGFKYKVTVGYNPLMTSIVFYLSPNPSGSLIYDLNPMVRLINETVIDDVVIHALSEITFEPDQKAWNYFEVQIYEAWIVDGVFTDDPDELGPTTGVSDLIIWNATYQVRDGYRPNPATRYALSGVTQNWLSDRRWNTHNPPSTLNLSMSTSIVYIPVRETDYGVISMVRNLTGDLATLVRFTIFAANGTPNEFEMTLTSDPIIHIPCYPANLNAFEEVGVLHPEDFPGWRYIQIRAETDDDVVVSVNYRLYNTAVYGPMDCKHDNVRIGWVNSAGGWDYFNFTKRNEITNAIEPKRFRQVLGTYGDTFTMTGMERGLTEREKLVEQTLTASSDWISENEFVFLRSLFVSKQVHWLHDDGTFTPVVVEDNSYTEQRGRNGKLVNQQIKLKMANEYWT